MGKKRITLASGRSCLGIQKVSRKNKPKKRLRNVPYENVGANELENKKCTVGNAGTKGLLDDDASTETSKDHVRLSVTTSGNCNSPMVTNDVYPPAKTRIISHDNDDLKCAPKLVMGPLEREYLKETLNNHCSLRYLGITYKRKNKVDFRKDESSYIFKVTRENEAPQNNTSANNSLNKTPEVGQIKNIIEESFTNESNLVSCTENLSTKIDVDVAYASAIECEDHSNSTILEDTTSKYGKVYYRKRWKNAASGTNSASLSGMFSVLPILNGRDEASLATNRVSSADKETKAVTNSCPDSEIEMPPLSYSVPNLTDETQSVDTIKKNLACNMIIEERIVSGCEHDTQQIYSDVNCTLRPNATSLNVANIASRSDDFKRKTRVLKCVTNEESISNCVAVENLLDRYLDVSTGQEIKLGSSPVSPVMTPISSATVLNCETNEESTSNSVAVQYTKNLLYRYHDASTGQEKELDSSPMNPVMKHVSSDTTKGQLKCSNLTKLSLAGTLPSCSKKKLIVLDLNGLLADINPDYRYAHKAHNKVGGKFVFMRPYCDDFLKFCFERFHVGVWSSRIRRNVDAVVDCLMGNLKHKLLFCWDQSRCTVTGHGTIENMNKPLLLKELNKLWNKEDPHLPWKKGEYSPYNTLLVDDSPCKSICNPPHTAIFPYPYSLLDENDKSLGPGGDLRVYLEGLAIADDVQIYVRGHPFGQKAIEDSDPHWNFYRLIIDKIRDRHR